MTRAINDIGLGTRVEPHQANVFNPTAIRRLACCDAVFGCVDSVDGRELLNRLAVYYAIPFIDVCVRLEADGEGGIEHIVGSVHYVHPTVRA